MGLSLQPHCLWILLGCENINHLNITLNPVGFVCVCFGHYDTKLLL